MLLLLLLLLGKANVEADGWMDMDDWEKQV